MMLEFLIIALTAVAAQSLELHHAHGRHLAPAVSYSSVSSPFGPIVQHGGPVPYPGLLSPLTYASQIHQHARIPYPVPVERVAHPVPFSRTDVHEDDLPAQYDFGYSVSDPITGDVKDQQEVRQGDNVQGRYSLIESDGTRRVVEYSADVNGFHAVVHKEAASGSVPVTAPLAASAAPLAPVVRSFQPVGVPAGIPYGSFHHPYGATYSAVPHAYNVAPAQVVAYNHLH